MQIQSAVFGMDKQPTRIQKASRYLLWFSLRCHLRCVVCFHWPLFRAEFLLELHRNFMRSRTIRLPSISLGNEQNLQLQEN